jgi:CO/xanthine dehydrogenase Mo-binding subunit
MEFADIGKRRPRVDGRQQVTGKVKYTADLDFPGMI